MPRKDKYHDEVRTALENDGWTITHDPYYFKVGGKEIYIDLGAERLLAAEKGEEKVAVEVKSFPRISFLTDFYEAIGKFVIYEDALKIQEPDRMLFLAIPDHIYFEEMEKEELVQMVVSNRNVHFFVFNTENQSIVKWIK